MIRYAQVINGVVATVIESETDPDGINGEWVACGDAGPGYTCSDGVFVAPVPAVDPCEWLIDHMPLLDRFGPDLRMTFLMSVDPVVIALRLDYFGRKWIDMQRDDLKAGFFYMAGVAIPVLGTISAPLTGMTPALVTTVFSTPVLASENSALRKLYF